jgi:uncharacterized protein (TIGR03435 family)
MLTATSATLEELAYLLSRRGNVPVVDQTSIAGRYDIDLRWTVEEAQETQPGGALDGGLVSAVERQLGLKLERRRLPYEMLVVDRVEKVPTAN